MITTTRLRPGRSSPARKVRPARGGDPSTVNRLAVVSAMSTTSGPPPPPSVALPATKAAIVSQDPACSRQNRK